MHSQKEARLKRKDEQKMKELRENNMEHLLKRREVTPWNQDWLLFSFDEIIFFDVIVRLEI